jgi:hypothetical protein
MGFVLLLLSIWRLVLDFILFIRKVQLLYIIDFDSYDTKFRRNLE